MALAIILFAVIVTFETIIIAEQAKQLDELSDKYLDAVTEVEIYEPEYSNTESWDKVPDEDFYI